MKIYEYAQSRNIKSKDVVKKLHEMGYDFIKNHLSLVPTKLLDELDQMNFASTKYVKKVMEKDTVFITMEYAPFVNNEIGKNVKSKVMMSRGRKIVICPLFNVNLDLEVFCELKQNGLVYKFVEQGIEYYFIDHEYYFKGDRLFGYSHESDMLAYFCKNAIELLKVLNEPFDVINIHDWPLGLFPLLFKRNLKNRMPNTIVEYTVYGSTYQGIYGKDVLSQFDLDLSYFDDVEHAMSVNLLKAGLVTAKKIDMNKHTLDDLKNSYLKQYVYDNM